MGVRPPLAILAITGRLSDMHAQLAEVQSGGKSVYRVRVGPYASQDQAQQAIDKLQGMGLSGSRMVKP